jgi:hypothetical protein
MRSLAVTAKATIQPLKLTKAARTATAATRKLLATSLTAKRVIKVIFICYFEQVF